VVVDLLASIQGLGSNNLWGGCGFTGSIGEVRIVVVGWIN
jgi:hypothetical protein